MTAKRFEYSPWSQTIKDHETGERYYGNQQLENILNELHEENTHIKHTIKTMMESERTELGKNILKQLKDRIE